MFIFSIFVPPDKNQQKYAETATCFRSLGENSPEDPAQVKERPTWRSIAKSRALYDQMAPQLCLFYISAKFDVRPQHAELIWCFFVDSWPPLYIILLYIILLKSTLYWSRHDFIWKTCVLPKGDLRFSCSNICTDICISSDQLRSYTKLVYFLKGT